MSARHASLSEPARSPRALLHSFSGVSADTAARLKEYDIEPGEDGEYTSFAEPLGLDGKNTCRINGVPSNVAALRQAGHELINIHGQHDNQALMAPKSTSSSSTASRAMPIVAKNTERNSGELCSYIQGNATPQNRRESEKLRQLDLADYQINELEQADIRPGERDELNERKTLLQNCEACHGESLRAAYDIPPGRRRQLRRDSAIGDCAGECGGRCPIL